MHGDLSCNSRVNHNYTYRGMNAQTKEVGAKPFKMRLYTQYVLKAERLLDFEYMEAAFRYKRIYMGTQGGYRVRETQKY